MSTLMVNASGEPDVDAWWRERLLDAVVPMNYTRSGELYRGRVEREWRRSLQRDHALGPPAPVQPHREKMRRRAPSAANSRSTLERQVPAPRWVQAAEPAVIMGASLEGSSVALQQKQLALALQRFGHFAVFCYSLLFSPPAPRAPPAAAGNKKRGKRPAPAPVAQARDSLLPFLQVLSHASELFKHHPPAAARRAHPFQSTFTRVHPEEHFPYDQLDLYDRVPLGEFLASPGSPSPSDTAAAAGRAWGERGGGRRVVGPDGTIVRLKRRTWRRSVLAEHQELTAARGRRALNVRGEGGDVAGEQPLLPGGELGELEAGGMAEAGAPPVQWEAQRMQDAIAAEEEEEGE
eukprot:jgi/Mesen1/245/ME1143319C07637